MRCKRWAVVLVAVGGCGNLVGIDDYRVNPGDPSRSCGPAAEPVAFMHGEACIECMNRQCTDALEECNAEDRCRTRLACRTGKSDPRAESCNRDSSLEELIRDTATFRFPLSVATTCQRLQCADACRVGRNWDCAGAWHFEPPPALGDVIDIPIVVQDYYAATPVQGVVASACARDQWPCQPQNTTELVDCASFDGQPPTCSQAIVRVSADVATGYAGSFLLSDTRTSLSPDERFGGLVMLGNALVPFRGEGALLALMSPAGSWAQTLQGYGIEHADDHGSAAVVIQDCHLALATRITVEYSERDDKTSCPLYGVGGFYEHSCDVPTTNAGAVVLANLPADRRGVLRVRDSATGCVVGRAEFIPRAGVLTTVLVRPLTDDQALLP